MVVRNHTHAHTARHVCKYIVSNRVECGVFTSGYEPFFLLVDSLCGSFPAAVGECPAQLFCYLIQICIEILVNGNN